MVEASHMYRLLIFFFILSLGFACNSSNKVVKKNSRTTENPIVSEDKAMQQKPDEVVAAPIVKDELGPDDIAIQGKLLRMITDTSFPDFPCNKYPCMAEVEIIEIIARGRTYPGNTEKGKVMKVIFPMTLRSSDGVFKDSNVMPYPGLKEGNFFWATMTGAQQLDSNVLQHTVISYRIIK
jgi:hypothetical protein